MSARHLKAVTVDTETGELVDEGCPHVRDCEECTATALAYEQLQRKYQGALSEIGRLKSDPEAEARKHKLWAEAETAHTWWRLACWHPGTKFEAAEFYHALPRLKERNGLEGLLKAIAGAAYDPGSKSMKNGDRMVFDDFELICRSKAKARSFQQRVYGSERTEKWKRWLIERIESNLEGAG